MALTYDLSGIADFKEKCYIPAEDSGFWLNPTTQALIFLSMPCGFGEIKMENVNTVWARIRAYEEIAGSMLIDRPMTEQDVLDHVGLTTNVGPMDWHEFERVLERARKSAERRAVKS
jgi:hypothetical protein